MSNTAATKTTAARLVPGMTVRVTDFAPIPAALAMIFEGMTAFVPCGSITAGSPTATVTAIRSTEQQVKQLRSIVVEFDNGQTVRLSTRQKVEVIA